MEKLSKTVWFARAVREGDCSVFVFNAQLTDAVIQWRHTWMECALCVALAIPRSVTRSTGRSGWQRCHARRSGSHKSIRRTRHCVPGTGWLFSGCHELRPDRAGALAVLHCHSFHWHRLGHGPRPTRFFCRTARHWPARQPGLADRRLLCRTRDGRAVRGSVHERDRHQPVLRGRQSRSRCCGHRRGALTGLTSTKGVVLAILHLHDENASPKSPICLARRLRRSEFSHHVLSAHQDGCEPPSASARLPTFFKSLSSS